MDFAATITLYIRSTVIMADPGRRREDFLGRVGPVGWIHSLRSTLAILSHAKKIKIGRFVQGPYLCHVLFRFWFSKRIDIGSSVLWINELGQGSILRSSSLPDDVTLRNIDLGVGTLESYFFAGNRDWIKMVLGFFHPVLCTDESLSWSRLFLHVFFVLILLQQRRHNQRRCKRSCHQWLTTSTKTYDLWLKLRCCLLGLLFFWVHCTLITKTKICLLSLGGVYNVSVEPALDLQVLCELSWSSVLLLPVSRWTRSGFGTRKKETKTRRENESWKSFTLEMANRKILFGSSMIRFPTLFLEV